MSMTISDTNENPQKDAANKSTEGGLEGVVAATTAISKVEGTIGRLIYRGYNIHHLTRTSSFQEVTNLLCFGPLPNKHALLHLKGGLLANRHIPAATMRILID